MKFEIGKKFGIVGLIAFAVFTGALTSACSGSSGSSGAGGGGNTKPQRPDYVNWDSVPTEFNPSIDEVKFQTTNNLEKIHVDFFGFNEDVDVIYTNDLSTGNGLIKIFKVYAKSASWGRVNSESVGKNLEIKSYGTYQCSIRIENQQIQALEGGCFVRVQILLPIGSELEVYNLGELISERFIPMTNEDFLKRIDDADFSDDKFAVIETFLASYTGTKKPALASRELGTIINEFMQSSEKFQVLRRLQLVVSDRQNLRAMIEREFGYFDREEALKIVGL